MPKLVIDQMEVEVPAGATVLDAARRLGIDIPTLCYLEGCKPTTSCLVCMVRNRVTGRLSPACGTPAEDGMQIESETDEVRRVRRAALELLLSDHLGDCLAPCYFACPAAMDIPTMLRQLVAGDLAGAIATVKADIALPAALGRVCPAPCEKACRRNGLDAAVAICLLKRFVADADLATSAPYRPPVAPPSGKRVTIIGGGPTGLSAAYYLARAGHRCTIVERGARLGGRLRAEAGLPAEVLDAEIETILGLGIEWQRERDVASAADLQAIRDECDALLLACGAASARATEWGLATTTRGLAADPKTFALPISGTFAAGLAVRGKAMIVRSVADGKEAAWAIDSYLRNGGATPPREAFSTKIGRMERDEIEQLESDPVAARREPETLAAGYSAAHAAEQAARCLHCDCRALTTCKLRRYAAEYGANPRVYAGKRRRFALDRQHAALLFEPGKCIDCGLCVQIAEAAGEPLGLTFVGRGFSMRVAAPLERAIGDALQKVAAACIAACPTAALAWRDRTGGQGSAAEHGG